MSLIRELIASGATRDQILAKYKQLTPEDIEQAIDFMGSDVEERCDADDPPLNNIERLDEAEFYEELKRRSGA